MKFISAILAAGVAALIVAAPVSAGAATTAHAAARSPGQYCVIEIAKASPAQAASRVIADVCSARHAPGSTLPAGVNTQKMTRLVQFFSGRAYTGRTVSLFGSAGPCNVIGYEFGDLRGANTAIGGIRSYKLYNHCQWAVYWRNIDFTGLRKGPIHGNNPYVGGRFAGHLWSMRIWA